MCLIKSNRRHPGNPKFFPSEVKGRSWLAVEVEQQPQGEDKGRTETVQLGEAWRHKGTPTLANEALCCDLSFSLGPGTQLNYFHLSVKRQSQKRGLGLTAAQPQCCE